jgi:hypothetical protein
MKKLAVIHFNPVESYPPALNFLNYLAREQGSTQVCLFSIKKAAGAASAFTGSRNIKQIRPASIGKKGISAYWNYFLFYLVTLIRLIMWRPDVILYYETLSAPPVIFYKRFFRSKLQLFIHYHEYTSGAEYQAAGYLVNKTHQLEKRIYPQAVWISQTNADRVRLFENDCKGVGLPEVRVFPNYPPVAWQAAIGKKAGEERPLKIVYVGALSLDTMYTREFAAWVVGRKGKVQWDIYSDNITPEARKYLESLAPGPIQFRNSVSYVDLPGVLGGYDIGVVLYKGHIPNYVYNAPNKLFEYLACGLDVWFPSIMKGSLPYVTNGTFPRVQALDFEHLEGLDVSGLIEREGLQKKPFSFFCEPLFALLFHEMNSKAND